MGQSQAVDRQSDPIGIAGGVNLYGYVGGNPLRFVDRHGLTWWTNTKFLWDFISGGGDPVRVYSPEDIETWEMQDSPGVEALRERFYTGGCRDLPYESYSTARAAWETLINPVSLNWFGTAAQVGGFSNAQVLRVDDSTIAFDIYNVAGANSFFYHILPNSSRYEGPFRTIVQVFQWTERIDPCECKKK